jgi:hypothetical protein
VSIAESGPNIHFQALTRDRAIVLLDRLSQPRNGPLQRPSS